jgi:hypothetical protein
MLSALAPQREQDYTLVMVIQSAPPVQQDSSPVLIGLDPRAPGQQRFLIYQDKGIYGGLTFETERGVARLSLPLRQRNRPVPLALVRNKERDRAYLGEDSSPISTGPATTPGTDPQIAPAIYLGGFPNQERYFHGRIYEILFYPRALSPREIQKLFTMLEERYPATP